MKYIIIISASDKTGYVTTLKFHSETKDENRIKDLKDEFSNMVDEFHYMDRCTTVVIQASDFNQDK